MQLFSSERPIYVYDALSKIKFIYLFWPGWTTLHTYMQCITCEVQSKQPNKKLYDQQLGQLTKRANCYPHNGHLIGVNWFNTQHFQWSTSVHKANYRLLGHIRFILDRGSIPFISYDVTSMRSVTSRSRVQCSIT